MGVTKELALNNILRESGVDVAFITETELEPEAATCFAIKDYITFLPPTTPEQRKVRIIALVKSSVATKFNVKLRTDLSSVISVWLELFLPKKAILGGVYRPWSGLALERLELQTLIDQSINATANAGIVVLTGDFNLDMCRADDEEYHRHSLLRAWSTGLSNAGLVYNPTGSTWVSHGTFQGTHRTSTLDHTYTWGVSATVEVLPDSSTDHRPLVTRVQLWKASDPLVTLQSRNFNSISVSALGEALEQWKWENICHGGC